MDDADELIKRLALLRPDLAVVPRTMSPPMTELMEASYQVRRAAAGLPDGEPAPEALQEGWSRALRHFEREVLTADFRVDHNAMLASGFLTRLVSESYPEDKVIFRTADGDTYTGAEMADQILRQTEVGVGYASNMMRVCRDLLSRQAQRLADAEPAPARAP